MSENVAHYHSATAGPGVQQPEWQQGQRLLGLNDLFQNSSSGPRAQSMPTEAWNSANKNGTHAPPPVPASGFMCAPPPPPQDPYPRQQLPAQHHHQGAFSYSGSPPWKHRYDIGHDDAPWGSQPQDWEQDFIPLPPTVVWKRQV